MSERARAFLTDWFSGHAHPLPVTRRMAEAVRLATSCRKDATAVCIPLQEIRDVSDGDLILKILRALDAAGGWCESSPSCRDVIFAIALHVVSSDARYMVVIGMCVQPVSATPLVIYRLAFGSPRSFADVD